MRRIEHPQLVQLPVVHAVGEESTDVLPRGPARRERVFEHPLTKRLRDHRPPVVEPALVAQEGAIGVGRLRRDAVDHRVREAARRLDPTNEVVAASLADTRYGLARDVSVSRQVVAAEDRQRTTATRTASVEPSGDGLDRRVRLVQRVAALGDRQRQNRDLRPGNLWRERGGVVGDEAVVDDAPDDPRTRAVAVTLDQGVEVILRVEHARDPTIGVEEPDAPNPPAAAGFRQLVDVERHVCAVEAADAEMQDSRRERCAVVVRYGDAATFDCFEARRRKSKRHAANVPREIRRTLPGVRAL